MPYSKLQTSLLLLYGLRQHEKAAAKLRQAIAQGQQEGDDRTVYTSLSLLGLGSLNSGRIDDALSVLEEIEGMITNRRSFVVGDETNFLEGLEAQKLEVDRGEALVDFGESVPRSSVQNQIIETCIRKLASLIRMALDLRVFGIRVYGPMGI